MSAREAYLRASNYYTGAEFFLHTNPSDPRIVQTWQKSRVIQKGSAIICLSGFRYPSDYLQKNRDYTLNNLIEEIKVPYAGFRS